MDTFVLCVRYHADVRDGREFHSIVTVLAQSSTEAELTALEMVAARGMTPVHVAINWDNF